MTFNVKPFLMTIGSLTSVGKTTFALALIGKIIKPKEKVCVITDDFEKIVLKKLDFLPNKVNGRVVNVLNSDKFFSVLTTAVKDKYDYVLIDCGYRIGDDALIHGINYLRLYNVNVILINQINRHFADIPLLAFNNHKIMQMSDYLMIIEKRTPNLFEKIISKVFFWIPLKNMEFKLIKNRWGREKNFNFHLNPLTLKLTNF